MVVPAMIEDMPVVSIYEYAFRGGKVSNGQKTQNPSDAITSLVLPQSVVFIDSGTGRWGTSAFVDMENLTSITLPEGLKEIPWDTFSRCKKLTKVNLPAGLEKIGNMAFSQCGELNDLVIPASLTGVKFWNYISGEEDSNNFAFASCGKLPIKTRQTIQSWGYKSSF